MIQLLTIEEVKDFLKITDDYDEVFLKKIVIYTQELLEKILDQKLNSLLTSDQIVPGDLKLVWLSFIAQIYDERSIEKIIKKNNNILTKYQKIYL